jgi:hypothetical protein
MPAVSPEAVLVPGESLFRSTDSWGEEKEDQIAANEIPPRLILGHSKRISLHSVLKIWSRLRNERPGF